MPNEILIHTDRGEYVGGDVIYGTVLLAISHPIAAHSLSIRFKGYEKVKWEYERSESYQENGETKWRTIIDHHHGHNHFFKDSFKLFDCPAGFGVGYYSYYFQYTLPPNLPGVFYKQKKRGLKYEAKTLYKVKAICDLPGKHDLKVTQHLVVHERLDKTIIPTHQIKTSTVRTLCCIPRGPVTVEEWIDKNAYMPGEVAHVHVKVTNNSSVNVDHFNTKLIRHITLNDGRGHHRTIVTPIALAKYAGCLAGNAVEKDVPLHLRSKKGYPKPSTKSPLIECKYVANVEMDIPWAPDIELYSPITIYAPQNTMWSNWVAPAWISQAVPQAVTNPQLRIPDSIIANYGQHGYIQPTAPAMVGPPPPPPLAPGQSMIATGPVPTETTSLIPK